LAKINEIGPNEIGPNEIGPNEIGPNEIGPNEIGPLPYCIIIMPPHSIALFNIKNCLE
jgi:hypothetical protein